MLARHPNIDELFLASGRHHIQPSDTAHGQSPCIDLFIETKGQILHQLGISGAHCFNKSAGSGAILLPLTANVLSKFDHRKIATG